MKIQLQTIHCKYHIQLR